MKHTCASRTVSKLAKLICEDCTDRKEQKRSLASFDRRADTAASASVHGLECDRCDGSAGAASKRESAGTKNSRVQISRTAETFDGTKLASSCKSSVR